MRNSEFKTVLDGIESSGSDFLLRGRGNTQALSHFKALSASVIQQSIQDDAGSAGNHSWWAKVFEETADVAHGGNTGSVAAADDRPALTLAQLKITIVQDLSLKELGDLRRRFAIDHHPDRAGAGKRDLSSCDMSLANDLIDRAIENLRKQYGPE